MHTHIYTLIDRVTCIETQDIIVLRTKATLKDIRVKVQPNPIVQNKPKTNMLYSFELTSNVCSTQRCSQVNNVHVLICESYFLTPPPQ